MDKINEALTRGVERIYPSKEALEKVLRSGKKIRLYQGFDPSMPNLHLGNLVGILKLKQFQDLGHEVIFLVGDFTGMIGDPTNRTSARKRLTRKQVLANCKNWKEQAGRILSFGGKNPAKIMFNSKWNAILKFEDILNLFSYVTAQQLIERDMFQKRIKKGKEIFFHELCYPIIQGYDSVAMDVDLEIGGSDQLFNMLVGRDLMKKIKNKEKFVLTTKLLVDSKGEKVGKTTGNALFLNASPTDMFGGIMSFPDDVILLGFELLTEVPLQIIKDKELEMKKGRHPMELKKELAFKIVATLHSNEEAQKAQKEFERFFEKRELPEEIPWTTKAVRPGKYPISKLIPNLIPDFAGTASISETKRLIKQGGLEFEGQIVKDPMLIADVRGGEIIKAGKRRLVKIKIKK